jgi:transcriptional regulator with XRE-family HTH domain
MFWDMFEQLCRSRGSSPTAVALELGFSNATATKWKKGSTPQGSSLQKIAEYFDVPIGSLLGMPSIATIAREEKGAPKIDKETFAKFSKDGVTVSICDHPDAEHQTNELWSKICRLTDTNRNKVDGYVSALLDEQDRDEIAKQKNA